jgi:hypothetical protein
VKLAHEFRPFSYELADHLNDIVAGMDFTIRGMIDCEVNHSGQLTTTEHGELEQRISDLQDWLCEHNVHSPLWCGVHGEDVS